MKKSLLFFYLFLLLSLFSSAQTKSIDSLISSLSSAKEDSNKVNLLNRISRDISRNDPVKGMNYAKQALELSNKMSFLKGQADAYNNLGIVYHSYADYSKALEGHLSALKIREKIKDSLGIASSYSNIGLVYSKMNDDSLCVSYYMKALGIFQRNKEVMRESSCYNNIGNVYVRRGKYDEAMKCFEKALEINKSINNKMGIASVYNSIGIVMYNQEKYKETEDYFTRSLEIKKEINDLYGMASSYNNLGSLYVQMGQEEKAIKALYTGLPICFKLRDYDLAMQIYEGLSEAYDHLHRIDSAYKYHKLQSVMKDSIAGDEAASKVAKIQFKYQMEKEEEIRKLQEEKTESEHQAEVQQNRIIVWSVVCGLILTLVFAGFILNRWNLTKKQKTIIAQQKELVEEKQKDILDSIHYAKRIQESLLPTEKYIDKNIKRLNKK